jgi:hypothetical protein
MNSEQKKQYAHAVSRALSGLADELLIYDADVAEPLKYFDKSLIDVTLILQHICMNKAWERQEKEDLTFEERCKDAERFGKGIRKLIKKFTGKDLPDIINEF